MSLQTINDVAKSSASHVDKLEISYFFKVQLKGVEPIEKTYTIVLFIS